ncbi:MAG: hypothetical protein PHR26_01040 [Candidatus ainarchaeum sp.]|nr:hypothetical protein [Candidatus ainarchaeum sp.]MDD3975851.1 hypothetical protein [Candidatus ainarchaeum sp.]
MKNYKIIVFIFLMLLCGLSGCIHLINTQGKQACISLTHFSNNTIPSCNTQKTCYQKVENLNFIEAKTTISINNNLLTYKNELANAYYHFNESKKILETINNECKKELPKDIENTLNDFFYYSGKIIKNIDSLSEKSIILLQNWLLYLDDQEIELISEEEIYKDFIVINQNLNELREETNQNTYIGQLNYEIKTLHEISTKFGFKETYLNESDFIDVYKYYLKFVEEDINSILIPKILKSYNYLMTKISKSHDLLKINELLEKADNYNYYLLLDRFVGTNKSITTEFIELNNKINLDLIEIYNKIDTIEKYIEENKENIDVEKYNYFEIDKRKFKEKKQTIGKYLNNLKNIENEIKINKNQIELQDKEIIQKIKECDDIIEIAKEYENKYFKNLVKIYENGNNLEKILSCEQIKEAINEKDNCLITLENIFELNLEEIEEMQITNYTDPKKCEEILYTIEEKLNYNIYINYLNKLLLKNQKMINNIEKELEENQFEKILIIKKYKHEIEDQIKQKNIYKIKDIEQKIEYQENISQEMILISKEIIYNFPEKYVDIKNINEKIYLMIKNPFEYELEEVEIENKYENIKLISNKLSKYKEKIKISKLKINENYFEIEYINNKYISQNIILLTKEYALIKLNIQNEINNIWDKIEIENVIDASGDLEYFDKFKIYYLSKKNNEIIYKKDILNKTIISENIEEVNDNLYLLKDTYTLKNVWIEDLVWDLEIEKRNDKEVVIIKINTIETNIFEKNGKEYFTIDIKKNNIKKIEEYTLRNKEDIIRDIENIIIELNELKQSKFENVKELIKNIKITNIKDEYNISEIKEIIKYKIEIENAKKLEKECIIIEKEFIKMYSKILQIEIDEKTKIKIENLSDTKYKNILKNYNLLKEIYDEIYIEQIYKKDQLQKENLIKIEEIKEKIKYLDEYKIYENKIKDIEYNKEYNKITELEIEIEQQIEEKAKKIYLNIIENTQNLNEEELQKLIEKIMWVFTDFSLEELYSIKYYPIITEKDIDRIEKKQKILDTITFNKEIDEYIENYENEEYFLAIKKIEIETLKKLEELNLEKKLLEEGLENIKNDSKKELTNFIQENEKEVEIINDLKNNYEEGKYLNVIAKIRTQKIDEKTNKLTYLIPIVIVIIISLFYMYNRLEIKEKKEKNINKKKKVIRHN